VKVSVGMTIAFGAGELSVLALLYQEVDIAGLFGALGP
jgi:hypothetical protein